MTSQSTTHYNLGKFIQTDIPSWLTDFNGNMDKLDNALYVLSQAQQTLQGDLDTAIAELETAQGNINSLTEHSAVQDSSINALQSSVTNITNSISAINTAITTINSSFDVTTTTASKPIGQTVPNFSNVQSMDVTFSNDAHMVELQFNVLMANNLPINQEHMLYNQTAIKPKSKKSKYIVGYNGEFIAVINWNTTGTITAIITKGSTAYSMSDTIVAFKG